MTTTELVQYGGRNELKELSLRLRQMMPSAQQFSDREALAVAQIAHAHGLDPFNGEVWGLKGGNGQWYGVMVGIKGLRKCARRAAQNENSVYWLDFKAVEPSKYNITLSGAIVYECTLRDTATTQAYSKAVHELTDAKIPYEEAVNMLGGAPVTIGIGVADPSERSKMGLHARARKRAEADALKTRYDVEFGNAHFTVEEEGEFVEGEVENLPGDFDQSVDDAYPQKSELQNLSELGFDTESALIEQKPQKRETEKPKGPVGWLLEWGVDHVSHAANIATKLKLTESMGMDAAEKRYNSYLDLKASGLSSDDAATKILEGA